MIGVEHATQWVTVAQLTDLPRTKRGRPIPRPPPQILLLFTVIVLLLILVYSQSSSSIAGRIVIVSHTSPDGGSYNTVPVVTFLGYTPSLLEQDWAHHIDEYQKDPCKPLLMEYDAGALSLLLRLVEEIPHITTRDDMMLMKHNTSQHEVLSAFSYSITVPSSSNTSKKEEEEEEKGAIFYSYIEPLFGYFRHPFALSCLQPHRDVLDPSYLIYRGISRDVFDIIYPGRKYLFDLGINGPNRSVEWLDEAYAKNGITFDEIWGWDQNLYNPLDFWSHISSPSLYTKLHLINVPVSINVSDPHHPFQIIKSIFRPGDYIALKMDIDAPTYEQHLAESLLEDKVLAAMIGDFFYEKHMGALHFPHHGIPPDDPVHNMKSVMTFFTSLRERGIRAHYWV
jgi:hypothetical protein